MIQIKTKSQDSREAHNDELRGLAEHVGSSRRQPFTNAQQLLAFLQADHHALSKEDDR